MLLPRFSGDDNPENWIFRAELYFTYLGFSKKDWLPLPSFYLEGDALAWFNGLFRNNQFYDWNHFKEKFLLHFQKRAFSAAARMADTSRACVNYLSCTTVVPPATYVSPAHSRIANFYESAATQIPQISEPNARVVDGDKYAIVVDEVFDENPHSHETAMHSQFSNDEALLVLPVGRDYFVPKSVEQFESLSINSTERLDAMKIQSDSDDEKLEEDQQGYTKVEDISRNMADQVFATNPQRNTGEQLIQFAPLNMDHLASLVPGDKFSFGDILVVLVRVHLTNGHLRDTYYCCHTRACACTYLYCAYESTREIIVFWSCMNNWFDTGQCFKDNSCVLLYGEPKDLYRNQEFSKTKVITSNLENLADGQFEGSFLSLGFHCKPTLKEDVKNILWFHHDCKIYLDCWCDTGQESNLPGFLFCKLRVQAREEKIQVMLQAFAKIYSKHSPHIREDIVPKLMDFLEARHDTTVELLAEKEQSSKGKKRRRESTKNPSSASVSSKGSAKSQKKTETASEKAEKKNNVNESEDESEQEKDADEEEPDVSGKLSPSDDELCAAIGEILREEDIPTINLTAILERLCKWFGTDLTPRKSHIHIMIGYQLNQVGAEDDDDDDED